MKVERNLLLILRNKIIVNDRKMLKALTLKIIQNTVTLNNMYKHFLLIIIYENGIFTTDNQ